MAASTRLQLRLRPKHKELIEQAAQLLGMTVTEFAETRLIQVARQVIAEHTTTRLTSRDRDIFLAMLEADSEPSSSLRKAFLKSIDMT